MSEKQTDQDLNQVNPELNTTISDQEKWEIFSELCGLYNEAMNSNDPIDWGVFAINAFHSKIVTEDNNIPIINYYSYKGINGASRDFFEKGYLIDHLKVAVAQKFLFPEEWALRCNYFHSDEIVWNNLVTELQELSPSRNAENYIHFFEFFQNMKIVAPIRSDKINLWNITEKQVWIDDIKDMLEIAKEDFHSFLILATAIHILDFPTKIVLEKNEFKEINEHANEFKKNDILSYTEIKAKQKLLSTKDIKITQEHIDLIF